MTCLKKNISKTVRNRAMKKGMMITTIFLITTSLIFTGCISNTDDSSSADGNNQVTLEMHTTMFDFSKGEIVTETGTSEDIDVITGAREGFIRLIARNGAEIMFSGDAEGSLYIDAFEGATCELIDREGGKATILINEIGSNTTDVPTVTITWTYIY